MFATSVTCTTWLISHCNSWITQWANKLPLQAEYGISNSLKLWPSWNVSMPPSSFAKWLRVTLRAIDCQEMVTDSWLSFSKRATLPALRSLYKLTSSCEDCKREPQILNWDSDRLLRSTANVDGQRGTLCQLKSCHLLHNWIKNHIWKGLKLLNDLECHSRLSEWPLFHRPHIISYYCAAVITPSCTVSDIQHLEW